MTESDVLDVLRMLADAGIRVWVDGGWGIDALIGRATRRHSDLDLVVPRDELDSVRDILAGAGFTRVLRDRLPVALALTDGANREIDLHPITGSADTGGDQLLPDEQRFTYPPPVLGTIAGYQIACVDAATQVRCHLGYAPTDKDRRDMALLRDNLGVPIPAEFTP